MEGEDRTPEAAIEAAKKCFSKRCSNCGPKQTTHYLYRIVEVGGSMVGRLEPGNILGEHRYYGPGHTWQVFDQKTWSMNGSYRGEYVGRAHFEEVLTDVA